MQRIVADLEAGGYVTRRKAGRRDVYGVDDSRPLRHPVEAHQTVAQLLRLGRQAAPTSGSRTRRK